MSTATTTPQRPSEPEQAAWTPSANPWVIAVSVMFATFMVVLDSSVANVALPHIAGNLSASTDESTWVLTSYLVSNAIMLPASGWIARRIGRRRLLLLSIVLFTGASLLCGLAVNLPMLIAARVLQGFGGGGMQPLVHAIMLESFPREQRGKAMAAYGVGVVVAPVIGPTLGGWITDSYSWRWIFYINLPVGLIALYMVSTFVEDPPYLKRKFRGAIDYWGFGLMALGLGALQLVLDKGQEADWFSESWICWTAGAAAAALIAWVIRELMAAEPIVQLRVLRDRNFSVGVMITAIYGGVLYGVTALLPLFLQTLLGYSALASGLAVSPRGIGSMVSMMVVAAIIGHIDDRVLLACGFLILGGSTLMLSQVNLGISTASVAVPNLINGFASGFIFVPLTTIAMGRLRNDEMGNATGVYNLMRNIGGSIGIAMVTTLLARGAQTHQAYLSQNVTGYNARFTTAAAQLAVRLQHSGLDPVAARDSALGLFYKAVQQQAALLAYVDNFRWLGGMALLCVPLALLFHRVRKHAGGAGTAGE